MSKCFRATHILARLLNERPDDGESLTAFNMRNGLPRTLTVTGLCKQDDIRFGLAYRIAKVFGYQIIFYNPNAPQGLEKMYVVGEKKSPIVPREHRGIHKLKKDEYTNTLYRVPRTYKKKKKKVKVFKEVGSNGKEGKY